MSEETLPKPFPEARPPHLPDVLTRQSAWMLFFGGVVAIEVWRLVQEWDPIVHGASPATAMQYGLSWISSLVPPLLGVTLVRRYPDARRRLTLLLFGLVLLSFGEVLSAFRGSITNILYAMSPPADEAMFMDIPALFAFRVFTVLLTIFGLLYLGAGLAAARVRPPVAAERPLGIWLAALAVIGTVLSLATLTQLPAEGGLLLVVQVIVGTILSGLVSLTWAYLAVVTLGGWMAGESPRRAWALGAISGTVLYGLRVLFPIVGFIPVDPTVVPVYWLLSYLSYAGWLALVAAFLLGLPTPAGGHGDAPSGAVEPTAYPPGATPPGS